jgi:hypothetical protein
MLVQVMYLPRLEEAEMASAREKIWAEIMGFATSTVGQQYKGGGYHGLTVAAGDLYVGIATNPR